LYDLAVGWPGNIQQAVEVHLIPQLIERRKALLLGHLFSSDLGDQLVQMLMGGVRHGSASAMREDGLSLAGN
jgi:hypothetical protein